MAKPRSLQRLMAFCVITLVLLAALVSPAFGQAPIYNAQEMGPVSPVGPQLFPNAPMQQAYPGAYPYPGAMAHYGAPPQGYPPTAFADFQHVDPSELNLAALAGHQFPAAGPMMPTTLDWAAYEQASAHSPGGFNISGIPHQRQQDAFAEFDPLAAQGVINQPQAAPTISYASFNRHGGHLRAFARPGSLGNGLGGLNQGATGGLTYAHRTPSWLKSFETGVYANYSGVTASVGGVFSLYEGPLGVVATRALLTGTGRPDSNSDIGVSLDMWLGRFLQLGRSDHYIKFGGFYDQQETLRKFGVATGGILFTNHAKCPPVIDIAIAMGDGQAHTDDQFLEGADIDFQMRLGFLFHQRFQAGLSVNAFHFENPAFEESIWSVGGYGQVMLSDSVYVNGDFQTSKFDVQGFLRVVWQPTGRHQHPIHGPSRNITRTASHAAYYNWLSQPVMRDISIRTGQAAANGTVGFLGNLRLVQTQVVFADLDGDPTTGPEGDVNGNGLIDNGDTVELNVIITADQQDAQNVFINNVVIVNTGATSFSTIIAGGVSAQVDIPALTQITIVQPEAAQVLALGFAGNNNIPADFSTFTLEVTADGECGRFRADGFTIGQPPQIAPTDATFLGLCP